MSTITRIFGAAQHRPGETARVSRLALLQPSTLVWALLAAFLIFLIIMPMARLVMVSLEQPETAAFTLQNYVDAYGKARHVQALWNTLKMGVCVVALSMLFAVPLAWACSRTDMPGRQFVRLCVLGAFITPPYLGAIGWILLAGPNAGWVNKLWVYLTGASEPLLNVFSFWGLVFVIATNTFFLIFVFTSSAFEMVSSEMEDSANILGAGPIRTALKITFPLIMPALMGSGIIVFLLSIALFGVPALLSIPARYPVAVIQLAEFFSYPLRVEVAAAYAMPLLIITAALLWFQRKVLARRGFSSITGKASARRLVRLGKWRWVMFGYTLFVAAITLIMPTIVLFAAAFSKAWGAGMGLSNLTLGNFHHIIFEHTSAQLALQGSVGLGMVSATVAILLALGIAYIVHRELLPFSGVLAFLCLAPFVVPGIVLAIGFYAAYAPPPMALYGTWMIIALAFITRFLPIAYTASAAGIRAVHHEMEEAVRVLGGGRMVAIRKVVAPMLKRTLAGGWLLIFVPATQELSTAIFLTGPHTRVVSVLVLDMSEEGKIEHLAALGTLLLGLTVIVVAIGFRFVGRDFMLRRE